MRLYVHTRNVTYIWKGTGSEKLESLLSDFVKAAASITGLTDPGVLTAALPSGKALAASDPVNKFFQDRDDVSVVVPAGTPPPKAVQKAPAAKPKSEVPPTGRRPAAAEIEESVRVITDLLSNAAIAVRNKNFAQARIRALSGVQPVGPRRASAPNWCFASFLRVPELPPSSGEAHLHRDPPRGPARVPSRPRLPRQARDVRNSSRCEAPRSPSE